MASRIPGYPLRWTLEVNMRILTAALAVICFVVNAGVGVAAGSGPATGAESGTPTVLVFGLGSKCRYCVELKQEIGKVTEETGDAVRFRDVLVDHDKVTVQRYKVLLSPTLVFLDAGGAEVFRHQGLLNAKQILERLVALGFWPRKG